MPRKPREILAHVAALARPQAERQRPTAQQVQAAVESQDRTAELVIYSEIGGWFGVWAEDIVPDLLALDVDAITVRLNSPGGDYFDGVAIANTLTNRLLHAPTVALRQAALEGDTALARATEKLFPDGAPAVAREDDAS